MDLKDKVAIITGAGAGIGKATAILLAQEGVKVCCNSITTSAQAVVEEISQMGYQAIFYQGDVSIPGDVEHMIETTITTYGKLDIVFNNAGIVLGGALHEMNLTDWDRLMAVNVRSIYLTTKYAFKFLKASQGVIINNASSVAFKGVKNRAAYTASKGAVLSLTRAMAADYLDDQIRVNSISPGTTDSPSLAVRLAQSNDPELARQNIIARQPLKRLGNPEEIATGVMLLIQNEFCTGVNLTIDGGMTM